METQVGGRGAGSPRPAERACRLGEVHQHPGHGEAPPKAAITAVFSFCPALNQPCGLGVPPQPVAVVVVEAIELAERAAQAAPVAEHHDRDDRDDPRERSGCGCSFIQRPPRDELAEASRAARGPLVSRTRNAAADPVHLALRRGRSGGGARPQSPFERPTQASVVAALLPEPRLERSRRRSARPTSRSCSRTSAE